MTIKVEAIYDNGVFRPVRRVALYNQERVTILIETLDDFLDHEFLAKGQTELAKMDHIPTVEETRELLRDVPGSFADEIVKARGH